MTVDEDPRPRVAVLATSYFAMSHADVLATRLLGGYWWQGRWTEPRIRVVSLYLEQDGDRPDRPDIGRRLAARYGAEVHPTVGEAMTCGGTGLAVDGVVSIAEHGVYELNEYGQQLYPHRRFFDAAVASMVTAGRMVPVYNDKQLGHSFTDARAMYDTAQRLGIAMLAGSTVPIAWRLPRGSRWRLGEPMTSAVIVGFGPVERYGSHLLEGLQDAVERRRGPDGGAPGESGVVSVQALRDDAARDALRAGAVEPELLAAALQACGLAASDADTAIEATTELFLMTHRDGLRSAAVNLGRHIKTFGVACAGPDSRVAYRIHLDPRPHRHWINQARQIEWLMLHRRSPTPLERTLLTTGVLDAAMHSRQDGQPRQTPELLINYRPATEVADTRVDEPLPSPAVLPDRYLSNTEEVGSAPSSEG